MIILNRGTDREIEIMDYRSYYISLASLLLVIPFPIRLIDIEDSNHRLPAVSFLSYSKSLFDYFLNKIEILAHTTEIHLSGGICVKDHDYRNIDCHYYKLLNKERNIRVLTSAGFKDKYSTGMSEIQVREDTISTGSSGMWLDLSSNLWRWEETDNTWRLTNTT